MNQPPFLSEALAPPPRHQTVGAQKDISYIATQARGVLNPPVATGMNFWSINPYVGCAFGCVYCYARYAHRYVVERAEEAAGETPFAGGRAGGDDVEELPPWLAFERRIFVKRNAADVLRRALQGRRRTRGPFGDGETIVIGTATDPYQPAERTFRITRALLEVLAEARRARLVIITKSPLITRDADLLATIAQRSHVTIHLSLITLDRELARRIEPRAPTPEARLRALRRLSDAGISVGINVMPILPGITDRPEALVGLVRAVADAGAAYVNAGALHLRAASRHRYLPWIAAEFPDLAEQYARAYGRGYQLGERYRDGLRRFMHAACRRAGIRYGSPANRAFRKGDALADSSGERGDAEDTIASRQVAGPGGVSAGSGAAGEGGGTAGVRAPPSPQFELPI